MIVFIFLNGLQSKGGTGKINDACFELKTSIFATFVFAVIVIF